MSPDQPQLRVIRWVDGTLTLISCQHLASTDNPHRSALLIAHPITSADEYTRLSSDPSVSRSVVNTMGVLGNLGIRQIEVLRLIGLGLGGPAIARQLNRSPKTIDFHREMIRERLGENSIVMIGQIAARSGIIHVPHEELSRWWGTGSASELAVRAEPAA